MAPTFASLVAPVSPPRQWVLPSDVDDAQAKDIARARATVGIMRATDAVERVRITAATPLWVPFWRVAVEVDGWVVDRSSAGNASSTSVDNVAMRGAVVICARRGFSCAPSERRDAALETASPNLPPNALVERAGAGESDRWLSLARVVDADVDVPEAEAFARSRGKRAATTHDTVFSSTKVRVEGSQLVWMLVWWVEYAYSGEAHPVGEGEFHVAFTAHDGGILAERHPSRMRAVTARVRHLLSLDPRGLGGPPRTRR